MAKYVYYENLREGEQFMEMLSIAKELQENAYPGRGIIIGKTPDGKKAVTAYFIMGRSENSRNRVLNRRRRNPHTGF